MKLHLVLKLDDNIKIEIMFDTVVNSFSLLFKMSFYTNSSWKNGLDWGYANISFSLKLDNVITQKNVHPGLA